MNAFGGGPIAPAATDLPGGSPDEWRGRCLNIYACNEKAVMEALEVARSAGSLAKIPHLAGQRFTILEKVCEAVSLTAKQHARWAQVLAEWRTFDARRAFLAHGVMIPATDEQGKWIVLFDLTVYRANVGVDERWAVRKDEATAFFDRLKRADVDVRQQLGHLRKLLSAASPTATAT